MTKTSFLRIIVLVCAVSLMSIGGASANNSSNYKFKVHNKTGSPIVRLLASEDGETYRDFNIGGGIAAGAMVTMEWDESTDESNCEWYFKAKLADGEETDPVEFDFCEKNLVLEIE
jgi:hypothetical protein